MSNSKEPYISIDVETAGPNPGSYSLLSIGACTIYEPKETFYVELQPVNENKLPDAMIIGGLDWNQLKENGFSPEAAMDQFSQWVSSVIPEGSQPIFVAFNAPFDWMFVTDYFHRYLGRNPFGYKALDIKAFYMGLHGVPWEETGMKNVARKYNEQIDLSHNALQDALDQARLFQKILADSENVTR